MDIEKKQLLLIRRNRLGHYYSNSIFFERAGFFLTKKAVLRISFRCEYAYNSLSRC